MSDPKDQPKVRPLSPPVRTASGSYRYSPGILTPEGFKVGAQGILPPNKVIPIIFIPGIMGSNVRVKPDEDANVRKYFKEEGKEKDYTDQAWRPPNMSGSLVKEFGGGDSDITKLGKTWASFSPKLRQALLNPKTTMVDNRGKMGAPEWLCSPDGTLKGAEEGQRRGWGTVHYLSYGAFLLFLETHLNWGFPHAIGNLMDLSKKSHKNKFIHSSLKAEESDVKKMLNYQFPVYAAGYNWLQCNKDSAQYILANVKEIITSYQAVKLDCKQVIIVTHSMGGLVGRMLSKLDAEGLILGVVHGAMPAVGAPLAYLRTVCGGEDPKKLQTKEKLLPEVTLKTLKRLMGRHPTETMPVMANSPGSLELLPNHLHAPGWLKLERESEDGVDILMRLPKKDPYEEIYREKERWYRLMDPVYIDPCKAGKTREGSWQRYLQNIKKAQSFHQELDTYYHPNDSKRGSSLFSVDKRR